MNKMPDKALMQSTMQFCCMAAEASPPGLFQKPAEPLLTVERLEKRFATSESPAVNCASFTVEEDELLALLGPSGCGKTTTLRMIGGFETPDSGRILLHGRDITGLPPEARGIGFVFQDYALFPHLNVLDNVKFGLNRLSRAEADARARKMLRLVGLEALVERKPHELSGGQQQRVALARTLVVAPPLVLLDEPFSNLDAAMRVETRQEVRRLLKDIGSAAILVTHDQEEALALADRIVVMEAGEIRQIGTPDEIYRNPVNAFVASFIGRSNIIPGHATGADAETPFGRLLLSRPACGAIKLAIRPEQIQLEMDARASALIVGREYRGHDQLYWIEDGDRRILVISGPGAQLPIGARVRLQVRECVTPLV